MIEENEKLTTYREYPYLVYARVSTDKDEQKDSLTNQVDICRYWLEQNKFEWNERSILQDEAKSGTMFLERTAMQLILKKARNREIKMVIFKSIHRLARDLKDALEIKEVLLGHGVRVVTIEEGYDSQYEGKNDMKFEMFSMFAAQYPKTQSVSISAALAAKVRKGHHIGKIPYGYDRVNQLLVIKEDEAAVIRKIFNWYNYYGYGQKTITNKLNEGVEEGTILPPKSGGIWQLTTIQRILRNRTFCGDFILNQYTNVKVDGRKKQIKNPKSKWTIIKDHHPAIVPREEFNKANNKKVVNNKRKVTPWNEFRGLLKCGHCGSNMIIMQSWKRKKDGTKTHWKYLKCSKYRRSNKCVNHPPITYEDFRKLILQKLIVETTKARFNLEANVSKNDQIKVKKIKNEIANLNNKIDRLLDIYLEGILNKFDYENKREELQKRIQQLEDKLFTLNMEKERAISIKTIKEALDQLNDTNKDLFHVFNVLIEYGVIYIDGTIDLKYKFNEDNE
ncbi:recombinase family protein [Gracilibacillus caseinilyticus]|uniref:Recombinase family protein n=1 Tax=Gracilibacillus caseinilyticus TaxID=2932256 RepID=A0ABY4EUC0_9BACI|nr:recombinase family protein [Gracilibacillus caseinilyticus]UOQ47234.1 recombinase family protein [Gracilibacillus caseinilyticus]